MSNNPPKFNKTLGNVSCSIWEGEFQGKTTYSFGFQKMKFNKQTNKMEFSNFFTQADMSSLAILAQSIAIKNIKVKQVGQQNIPVKNVPKGDQGNVPVRDINADEINNIDPDENVPF